MLFSSILYRLLICLKFPVGLSMTTLDTTQLTRKKFFWISFWIRTDNGFRIPNFLAHQVATPRPISLATEVINFVFVAARSRRDRLQHKLDMLGWSKLSSIVIRSVVVTADAILDILPTLAIRWKSYIFKKNKIPNHTQEHFLFVHFLRFESWSSCNLNCFKIS